MSDFPDDKLKSLAATYAQRYYSAVLQGNAEPIAQMHSPTCSITTAFGPGVALPDEVAPVTASIDFRHVGAAHTSLCERIVFLHKFLEVAQTLTIQSVDAVRSSATTALITVSAQLGSQYLLAQSVTIVFGQEGPYVGADALRIFAAPNAVAFDEALYELTTFQVPVPAPPETEELGGEENNNNNNSSNRNRGGRRNNNNNGNNNGGGRTHENLNRDAAVIIKGIPKGFQQRDVFYEMKAYGWVDKVDLRGDTATVFFRQYEEARGLLDVARRQGVYFGNKRVRVDIL